MTERGLPGAEGTPACPFVAFADEREERSDRPDHRHRCFAEEPPAPRAAAHQEAYCLSSAFPVCPTFQDWARREAAHARAASATPPPAPSAPPTEAAPSTPEPAWHDQDPEPAPDPAPPPQTDDLPPHRNPPRDWAAPPPWAGSTSSRSSGPPAADESIAPAFLAPRAEGQGLAGSPADRLAGGAPPDPSLAALVGGAAAAGTAGAVPDVDAEADAGAAYPPPTSSGRRPAVSSTRSTGAAAKAPPPRREHVQTHDGPSWERQRRYEAYPTIKTRSGVGGLPNLPRVGVLAIALVGAAVVLFFLPALLGVGGGDDEASPSPTRSAAAPTASASPTPVPAPTQQVYVIKAGDTLSGIAAEFGISLEELLAANEETIPDPDLIAIGDEIIIPAQLPDEVEGGGSAAPEDSPAP